MRHAQTLGSQLKLWMLNFQEVSDSAGSFLCTILLNFKDHEEKWAWLKMQGLGIRRI